MLPSAALIARALVPSDPAPQSDILLRVNAPRPRLSFLNSYQATWHCIVGRHFGSYVTHEKSCYCYFYVGQMGVLAWKTP